MDLRQLCVSTYQDFVKNEPMPDDLRRALKTHERVPVFIDGLVKELSNVKHSVPKQSIIDAVHSMSKVFLRCVEQKAKELYMSDIAKLTIKKKADDKLALDAAVDALGPDEETTINGKTTHGQTIKI